MTESHMQMRVNDMTPREAELGFPGWHGSVRDRRQDHVEATDRNGAERERSLLIASKEATRLADMISVLCAPVVFVSCT